MSDLRKLGDDIKPSSTNKGDGNSVQHSFWLLHPTYSSHYTAISAIILAIQMIITHCKKLKYKRKIVLITNGRGRMSSENLEDITKKIKEDNIELVILYVSRGSFFPIQD